MWCTRVFLTLYSRAVLQVQVDYITMPGWKSSIAGITSYSALPTNAKNYEIQVDSQEMAVIVGWW